MSGCFDGRNGEFVKTSGDLKDLRDLQFEEICWNWNCRRFTWQVFFKSLRNHTSHQVWGLFGGTLVIGLILRSLWGLYKVHETLWFYLVSL